MTTLHLGVTEASYAHGGKTTGDVAEILEDKYHIFEHFWQLHREKIVAELSGAVVGAFESVVMGSPPPADPHAAAMTEVQQLFNVFLDQREMDALGYPGIPTAASLAGVNHRLKHPYRKRNKSRPSFVDTGLLENSMRAWVTE